MDAKEKKFRADNRFEIRARKIVLKRLKTPLKLARAAANKKEVERRARIEAACAYESYQDAQNAYGWGMITEEEFDEIVEILEKGAEELEKCRTPEEAAAQILEDFAAHLEREIRVLEWENLPEKEKARIRQQNMEILERRRQRKDKEE